MDPFSDIGTAGGTAAKAAEHLGVRLCTVPSWGELGTV